MVQFATYQSPFGFIEIGYENGHILSIQQVNQQRQHIPCDLSDRTNMQLQAYFLGQCTHFDLPILLKGTDFQLAVWNNILQIPYGETRTYGQIAASIGKPHAARAVGQAANRNPCWIVVPCHRVVGQNNQLTGYAGGLDMKRALLALEQKE